MNVLPWSRYDDLHCMPSMLQLESVKMPLKRAVYHATGPTWQDSDWHAQSAPCLALCTATMCDVINDSLSELCTILCKVPCRESIEHAPLCCEPSKAKYRDLASACVWLADTNDTAIGTPSCSPLSHPIPRRILQWTRHAALSVKAQRRNRRTSASSFADSSKYVQRWAERQSWLLATERPAASTLQLSLLGKVSIELTKHSKHTAIHPLPERCSKAISCYKTPRFRVQAGRVSSIRLVHQAAALKKSDRAYGSGRRPHGTGIGTVLDLERKSRTTKRDTREPFTLDCFTLTPVGNSDIVCDRGQ